MSFVPQCSSCQNLGMGLFAFKVKQIYVRMALYFKKEGIKSPDSRYMFYFDATKSARFKTICKIYRSRFVRFCDVFMST